MINSRQKGNRAERAVLKILKEAFGSGPWERKPMGIPGPDLLTPQDFPWCVEVKDVKTMRVKHLVFKPTKELLKFWEQAKQQSQAHLNKNPLLCIKVEGDWYAVTNKAWSHCVSTWGADVVSILPIQLFCGGDNQTPEPRLDLNDLILSP